MPAILFGSIGTIADTSELQREAFNRAFETHGLDWSWSQDEYAGLLEHSGGADRVAAYAPSRGEDVDAAAIHETKSELFQASLAESHLQPRPGVVDALRQGRESGFQLALVTTTSKENVSALMRALAPDVEPAAFDLVVDSTDVDRPKPDDAAYRFALQRLGERPDGCVAIEDNVGGVQAATATGLTCVAFPNENTAGHGFDGAERQVDHLSFPELRELIPQAA